MKINSILFDMDGVLVHSEDTIRNCCIEALSKFGITAKHSDFIPFTGMGEERFIGGVAEKYGKVYDSKMKDLAYKLYGERALNSVIVYEGIKDLIYLLKEKGYKIAIASSADRVKVEINLKCIGVEPQLFNVLITGSDIINKKPHPEIYLKAAKEIGTLPQNCIVIEDAISGIGAGKAANMLCIGVTSTFDKETLIKAGADYIVEKTKDIISILSEINT